MDRRRKYRDAAIRIVSWNIRAGGGKRAADILAQLHDWRPSLIGLCEFRGTTASQWLAAQLAEAGFEHQLTSVNPAAPATNALLLASRFPLSPVSLPGMPRLRERWLLARVATRPELTLGLMHIPNHTEPRRKYPYMNAVLRLAKQWQQGPGLMIGATNCGKRGIEAEIPSPAIFRREHDWMHGMEKRDWVDAFRHLEGERREYTWYSHRDNGFRLDHAFCSPELAPALIGTRHSWGRDPNNPQRRDALSDHAGLIVEFDVGKIPNLGKTRTIRRA